MAVNGRPYTEIPQYVVEYPTKAASTYPTKGVNYEKAVCVPKVELKQ